MNKREKERFIKGLIHNVENHILDKIDQMPKEWDGFELRQLVVDYFQEVNWCKMNRKRMKEYKNTVIVENLI